LASPGLVMVLISFHVDTGYLPVFWGNTVAGNSDPGKE
jgi:hypothetical protein